MPGICFAVRCRFQSRAAKFKVDASRASFDFKQPHCRPRKGNWGRRQPPHSPRQLGLCETKSRGCSKVRNRGGSITMVHKVLFWGGFGAFLSPSPPPLPPCRSTTNKKLEQALQFAHGNSASKCDLSSTRNHFGPTLCSEAWGQASGTGYKA
jgi:hypothetical protein